MMCEHTGINMKSVTVIPVVTGINVKSLKKNVVQFNLPVLIEIDKEYIHTWYKNSQIGPLEQEENWVFNWIINHIRNNNTEESTLRWE